MDYRVTLTLRAPALERDEGAAGFLDSLLSRLLQVDPDSGAVVDACAGEPQLHVTLALDAPDAAMAVYAATRSVERAFGGPPAAAVIAVSAEEAALEHVGEQLAS